MTHEEYWRTPWPLRVRAAWRLLFGRGALGWRDPLYLAAKPGEERALRVVAMLLILQRVSYIVPGVVSLFHAEAGEYRSPALNAGLLVVMVGWTIGLTAGIRRRGWFSTRAVVVDAVLISAVMVVGVLNVLPGQEFGPLSWPTRFALASAALIGAALSPGRAVRVGLLPVVAELVALVAVSGSAFRVGPFVGHLNSYFWFGAILYFMRRYLTGQARALDTVTAQRLAAESRRANERAVFEARIKHYRTLHDTALSTLTAIAHGGLDYSADAVRQRCARDADLVRRLVQEDLRHSFTDLGDLLGSVVVNASGLGLRVRYQEDRLPADIPTEVVDAVADAASEALNNVGKHSGVTEAWLTAWWEDDVLTVRVVDRGVGFDPETTDRGFGTRWSMTARMAEVGGAVAVSSAPGEGTCVELRWPAQGRRLESSSSRTREARSSLV